MGKQLAIKARMGPVSPFDFHEVVVFEIAAAAEVAGAGVLELG